MDISSDSKSENEFRLANSTNDKQNNNQNQGQQYASQQGGTQSNSTNNLGKWTLINSRKRQISSNTDSTNAKKQIKLQNRYQALEIEEIEQAEDKAPPIFIPLIVEFQTLLNSINDVAKDSYDCKLIGRDQIRLQPKTSTAYRSIVKKLKEEEVSFHTYQPKEERKYRVVLCKLHPSINISEVKLEIEEHGHKVANIFNIKHRITKEPLSMFYVDLYPAGNNKEIFNIKYLHHCTVHFEAPHVKKEIVQCTRCQRYGHTKTYCYHHPRCVKCGKNHWTKECVKTADSRPTCVLCKEAHPSNYKGCTVYKDLQRRKYPSPRPRNIPENPHRSADNTVNQPQFTSAGTSYAQAIRNTSEIPSNSNLEQMMAKLMDRMDTMLNILTSLVAKIK